MLGIRILATRMQINMQRRRHGFASADGTLVNSEFFYEEDYRFCVYFTKTFKAFFQSLRQIEHHFRNLSKFLLLTGLLVYSVILLKLLMNFAQAFRLKSNISIFLLSRSPTSFRPSSKLNHTNFTFRF